MSALAVQGCLFSKLCHLPVEVSPSLSLLACRDHAAQNDHSKPELPAPSRDKRLSSSLLMSMHSSSHDGLETRASTTGSSRGGVSEAPLSRVLSGVWQNISESGSNLARAMSVGVSRISSRGSGYEVLRTDELGVVIDGSSYHQQEQQQPPSPLHDKQRYSVKAGPGDHHGVLRVDPVRSRLGSTVAEQRSSLAMMTATSAAAAAAAAAAATRAASEGGGKHSGHTPVTPRLSAPAVAATALPSRAVGQSTAVPGMAVPSPVMLCSTGPASIADSAGASSSAGSQVASRASASDELNWRTTAKVAIGKDTACEPLLTPAELQQVRSSWQSPSDPGGQMHRTRGSVVRTQAVLGNLLVPGAAQESR
jgi:hypothetical protein